MKLSKLFVATTLSIGLFTAAFTNLAQAEEAAPTVETQATPSNTVPDDVYEKINILDVHFLVKGVTFKPKPFTRDYVAELVLQAKEKIKTYQTSADIKEYVQGIITDLEKEFAPEIKKLQKK